ncbi:MAG: helix-turn-helix domain-containing protein [Flavobacteriaceae bacterium]|nr:MAG: helix-turn-helix domain-containing protein [Flavobacteriaceae bacterium]
MKVICIQEEAYYALLDEMVAYVKSKEIIPDEWIDSTEAMRLLNIKSKTTLQTYRDEGKIVFSQPSRKVILYSRKSIMEFLEKNTYKF